MDNKTAMAMYPGYGYSNPVEDRRRVDLLAGLFECVPTTPEPTPATAPTLEPGACTVSRASLWAGNTIFTADNGRGDHYTFRVTWKEPKPDDRYSEAAWFVALLTGPDNDRDYTYMGMLSWPGVFPGTKVTQIPYCKLTRASKLGAESIPVKVFGFAMRVVYGAQAIPAGYSVLHDGHCAKCRRHLTDPESLKIGLGPTCRGAQ